jgi:hypothetical protein
MAILLIFVWQPLWRPAPQPTEGRPAATAPFDAEAKAASNPNFPDPFVVASSGNSFVTLSDAVQAAQPGDTIEIHGRGPFPTSAIYITNKPLIICSVGNERPTIQGDDSCEQLISTDAELTLRGLEFQWQRSTRLGSEDAAIDCCAVRASGDILRVEDCRLIATGDGSCINFDGSDVAINNSYFSNQDRASLILALKPRGTCRLQNSILVARTAIIMLILDNQLPDQSYQIQLKQNTIRGENLVRWLAGRSRMRQPSVREQQFAVRVDFETQCNLFDVYSLLLFAPPWAFARNSETLDANAEYIRDMTRWRGEANYYSHPIQLVQTSIRRKWKPLPALIGGLPEWQDYWQSDTESLIGMVTYKTGNDSNDPSQHAVLSWDPVPPHTIGYRELTSPSISE